MTLLPANSSLLERALDQVAGGLIERIAPPFPVLMNARETPAAFLPYLAADRGIGHWTPSSTEAQKRAAVAAAWEVKRLAGTRYAIRRALAAAGYDVLSIEGGANYQREWESLGGQLLDGAWSLDGDRILEPPAGSSELLRAAPLDHWSKYAIRINTADGTWSREQQVKIRELAEEHGPLRSELTAIVVALQARLGTPITLKTLATRIRQRYAGHLRFQPAERRTLDGCWHLSAASAPTALDGTWRLSGQPLTGITPRGPFLSNGHMRSRNVISLRLRMTAGGPRPHAAVILGGHWGALDGTWSLSSMTLQGWPLDAGIRLADGQLDRLALPRLDGTWSLGPAHAQQGIRFRGTVRTRKNGLIMQEAL